MSEVNLQKLDAQIATHQIWSVRGRAIDNYAQLEQSLCALLAYLAGTSRDVAAVIFFKITNARARNDILDKLVRKKHGTTYALWWNSFIKDVGLIDRWRNEVVHWHSITDLDNAADDFEKAVTGVSLEPPNFWDSEENGPKHTVETLTEFCFDCDYLARSCNVFGEVLKGHRTNRVEVATYERPIIYPPYHKGRLRTRGT